MVIRKKQMYRDPEKGKIAGVCAGLADYFGWELWIVRIIALTALIFLPQVTFVAYVISWFVIDKKKPGIGTHESGGYREETRYERSKDGSAIEVKTRVWEAGKAPKYALSDIEKEFRELEADVGQMEGYVTSSEYRVKQEINRL